jgi:hypothetical protein
MTIHRRRASLLLLPLLLTGCGTIKKDINDPSNLLPFGLNIPVSGNWQLSSSAAIAAPLPALAGALSGSAATLTGLFHPATACVPASTLITLTGSTDANRNLTLTSKSFSGSVLTIKGLLAEDGASISNATYTVAGGACAFTAATPSAPATAPIATQRMASVSGTYQGTFSDLGGYALPISATLTQTTQPDSNGVFHLQGTATFAGNQCLASAVVVDSTVSGSALSATYTQTQNGMTNTVVASGTFSPDATVLTVTNWQLSGDCGADQGTGTLTRTSAN